MIDYALRLGITPTGKNEDPTRLIDFFDDAKDLGHPDDAVRNDFRFLSNFWPDEPVTLSLEVGKFRWSEREFRTGEHAYAAAKASTPKDFNLIADAPHPQQAKALGREIDLVADWEEAKYDVMRQVLNAKFAVGTKAAGLLLDTGTALLVEGTWWYDRVWGVDLRTKGTPGSNWLGVLLMSRRAELQCL